MAATEPSYYREFPDKFLLKLVEQFEESEKVLTDEYYVAHCKKQKNAILNELQRRREINAEIEDYLINKFVSFTV